MGLRDLQILTLMWFTRQPPVRVWRRWGLRGRGRDQTSKLSLCPFPQIPQSMTTERLQKFLSRAGVASRRAAEGYIQAGRVAVNGQVVTVMGVKVDPDKDVVEVDGRAVKVIAAPRTVMLHKPYGYVCTTSDPEGRRVVTELLGKMPERLYPVGRLDYDATGLLLLTNDGELAYRLTHPSYVVPRSYRVTVAGEVSKETVRQMCRGGGPGWPGGLPRSAGEQAGTGENRVGNNRA